MRASLKEFQFVYVCQHHISIVSDNGEDHPGSSAARVVPRPTANLEPALWLWHTAIEVRWYPRTTRCGAMHAAAGISTSRRYGTVNEGGRYIVAVADGAICAPDGARVCATTALAAPTSGELSRLADIDAYGGHRQHER